MNLHTIPPHVPFLDALACWWLEQRGEDPLAVADGLILLPTRRAGHHGLGDGVVGGRRAGVRADGEPVEDPPAGECRSVDCAHPGTARAVHAAVTVPTTVPSRANGAVGAQVPLSTIAA